MQPESSDGFASVGTVLPKEEVALLPGGLFVVLATCFRTNADALQASSLRGSRNPFCGIAAKPVE